jgi:hypothetical protein
MRRILDGINTAKQIPLTRFKFRQVRKRPITVEAAEIDRPIFVETPDGLMRADQQSVLIRGRHGEIYPCKKEFFEQDFEEVQ